MHEPKLSYDEICDTLYVSFQPGEIGTGVELTDHILLRLNMLTREVIGITLLDYSVLVQRTDLGARSFPLTGLADLAPETRAMVLEALMHEPVGAILVLSAYSPVGGDVTPIVAVRPITAMADAA